MKSTKNPNAFVSALFTKTALVLLAILFLEFSERNNIDPEINNPEEALNELIYGNNRFLDNEMIYTDYQEQIQKTKNGQHPHSFVLSCIDSRVPPEIVLDQGIGHLFVARVAGNVEDDNILGSMEYAVEVKHTKLIVVLGHSHCGAVQGAIDNVKLEHLTQLTEQIKPAFSKHLTYPIPEHIAEETSKLNVKMTMKHIYENSATIKHLVDEGKVKIVGAYYDIHTGEVNFFKK